MNVPNNKNVETGSRFKPKSMQTIKSVQLANLSDRKKAGNLSPGNQCPVSKQAVRKTEYQNAGDRGEHTGQSGRE